MINQTPNLVRAIRIVSALLFAPVVACSGDLPGDKNEADSQGSDEAEQPPSQEDTKGKDGAPWALDVTKHPSAKAKVVVQDIFDKKCVSCHSGGASDPFPGKSDGVSHAADHGSSRTAPTSTGSGPVVR